MDAAVYRPNGPGFSSAERPNGPIAGRGRPALARRDRTDTSGADGGWIDSRRRFLPYDRSGGE